MLDRITDFADPFIAEWLWLFVVAPILDRIRWVFKTKESREALHRALGTGVDLVSDALVAIVIANPIGFKVDQLSGRVADYALDSVPDAIRFLLTKSWFMRVFGQKPVAMEEQRAWIEKMATAKLRAKATEILVKMGGSDPLTNALRDAGAPVGSPGANA